jgi:peptidoglycan biosynthesis protein MviN/MurJ (putative lipid II flippase)
VIFAESAQELLTNRSSAEIVGELLLPYSVWMISMGMNAVLSRVMFGLGLEKNFTLITLVGYAVANLARVASFGELEFAWAVLLGALVEILFSTVLFYSVRRRLVAVARAAGPAGDTP